MALEIFKNLDRTKKIFLLFWYVIVMFWIMLNFFFQFYRKEKFKISKLKISGTEAEFKSSEEDKDETIFDKDIKELVYIIANSGTEIIVFEDLDRYDNPNIFIKLRELNFLVNKYNETNGIRHTVKFIYMVKDGMFTAKDRVKFFDFIIPIIPVVDSNNSSAILTNLLKNFGYELDDDIIFKISLYIDDMRLLKNIANEFNTYYNVVLKEKIENEDADKIKKEERYKEDISKLFALIVVKNVVPDEFDSLLLDDGYIYSIINGDKNKYVEYYRIGIELKERGILTDKELQYHIDNASSKPIKELFNGIKPEDLDKIFDEDINKIKNQKYLPLIKMLILDGLIDEAYKYYISIFHEGYLGKNDNLYLRNLFSATEQEVLLDLENPDKIIARLKEEDLRRFNSLNLSMLKYLLKDVSNNRHRIINITSEVFAKIYDLKELLNVLNYEDFKEYIDIIYSTCITIETFEKFLKCIEDKELIDKILSVILSRELMLKEEFDIIKKFFRFNIIYYIKPEDEENFFNNLKKFKVKFNNISLLYKEDDKEITKNRISKIINYDLLEININNINFLLKNNYNDLILRLILKNRVLMQDIIEKNNLLKEINEDLVIYLANSEIDEEEIVELIKAKNLKNSIDKSKIDKSKTKILKYLEGSETPDIIEETE